MKNKREKTRRRKREIHRGKFSRSDERRIGKFLLEVLCYGVRVRVPGAVFIFQHWYLSLWADFEKPAM